MNIIAKGLCVSVMFAVVGCVKPLGEEERAALRAAESDVVREMERDVRASEREFVQACVSSLAGQATNNDRISRTPFQLVETRGERRYQGHWTGALNVQKRLVVLDENGEHCTFRKGPTTVFLRANGTVNWRISQGFEEALRTLGFELGTYNIFSAGRSAVNAGLRALIPGSVYRHVDGEMGMTRDGVRYNLRIIEIRDKSSHGRIETIVTIRRK